MGALRDFVSEVLEMQGSAVEAVEPDGLEVLAPGPLRTAMGWPELVRLGFGAELPAGATAVGFEGDWLDRFGALLGDRGRWAQRQFVLPGPPPRIHDPARLLDHAIEFPNAVWRLQEVSAAWTRCLLLAFRYTAVSDERSAKDWSGSLSIREREPSSTPLRRVCVHSWRRTRIGRSPTRRSGGRLDRRGTRPFLTGG